MPEGFAVGAHEDCTEQQRYEQCGSRRKAGEEQAEG